MIINIIKVADTLHRQEVLYMTNATLSGIPETMLWTLHNRAGEIQRSDSILNDPECLKIYQAIDYDYERSFGKSENSHAVRSQLFDQRIEAFLQQHPDGVIVNLGEGLETQRFRIHQPYALWLTVDLPEGIAIREQFIQPDEKHLHIAMSALDTSWFEAVPKNKPVFISAQGLFMYFTEQQMQTLITALSVRFNQLWLMFDYIPPWLSRKTLSTKGWMKTPHYRTPPMPWGISRPQIAPLFKQWMNRNVQAENIVFLYPRGLRRYFILLMERIPPLRNLAPGVCLIKSED